MSRPLQKRVSELITITSVAVCVLLLLLLWYRHPSTPAYTHSTQSEEREREKACIIPIITREQERWKNKGQDLKKAAARK
eukprot:COSAG05_NODE_818_length_7136_cov_1156.705841_4_plen_80_part_00